MIPETPGDLTRPLIRHTEPPGHLRTRDRVLPTQAGPGQECLQPVAVLPADRFDILCDGVPDGAGSLGVDGCPEAVQVAPQEPLALSGTTGGDGGGNRRLIS